MSIADKLTTIADNQQKIYEAGKKAEHDAFWDAFQEGGTRTNYDYAFYGPGWTNESFKPKYDIKGAEYVFADSNICGDLTEILDGCGVSLNFEKVNFLKYAFSNSKFSAIGTVKCINMLGYSSTFRNCTKLEKIEKMIVSASQSFTSTFAGATALKELYIEGTIAKSGLTLSQCPLLTHDSLMTIINCLADVSGETSTYKVTLGSTNIAKLTADELLIAENKGWTVA